MSTRDASPDRHPADPLGAHRSPEAGAGRQPGAASAHHPRGAASAHHPPGAASAHHPPGTLAALRPPRLLLNVLLAGAFLRFANLEAWPLWLDEGATWVAATKPTWTDTLLAEANHPPLWWLLTRGWIGLFGDGEFALRAPAAILGLLGVWLVWCAALRVLDPALVPSRGGFLRTPDGGRGRQVAAWTTGLVAVSAYFLEYAQEARMYPLLMVLALGATLAYLRWLDRGRLGSLVAYGLLGTLALYTHYFGVLVLGSHAVHALWVRRRDATLRVLPFLATVALSGVLFLPWFAYLATHYAGIARVRPEPFSSLFYAFWRIGVGPAILATDPERAAMGGLAVIRENLALAVGTAVLWIVPVALGLRTLARHPGLRAFLLATLLFPVGFVLAVFPFFALIHERYFVFFAPWVVLLAVLGAFSLPAFFRSVALAGLALLAAAGAFAYHGASPWLVPVGHEGVVDASPVPERFVPDPENVVTELSNGHPYGREPWREVHAFVRGLAGKDDLVAIHAWYMDYVWRYYALHDPGDRPPLDTLLLGPEVLDSRETWERYRDVLADRERVFLVLSHEETEDPDHWRRSVGSAAARQWMEERAAGFRRVGPVRFPHGVRVEIFERK